MAEETATIPQPQEFTIEEQHVLRGYVENHDEINDDLLNKYNLHMEYDAYYKEHPEAYNIVEETIEEAEETTTEEETNEDGTPLTEEQKAEKLKAAAEAKSKLSKKTLSVMLKGNGFEGFDDDDDEVVITKIKTKFKDSDEVQSLRDATTKYKELLSVKPEEKYDAEVLELNKFKTAYKLPVKAAAALLDEVRGFDPKGTDAHMTALMLQFKMENPTYKGTDEQLKNSFNKRYAIDPEDIDPVAQAQLETEGNKAMNFISEAKTKLAAPSSAPDLEAVLAGKKSVWSPIVEAYSAKKDMTIDFTEEGEKYSIKVPPEFLAKVKNDVLMQSLNSDVSKDEDVKAVENRFKAMYFLQNPSKIIHETVKGIKEAHKVELANTIKAKDKEKADAVKAKENEQVNYKKASGQDIRNGNKKSVLDGEMIALNNKFISEGKKPYFVTGKESWDGIRSY